MIEVEGAFPAVLNPYCRHGDVHSFCPYSPEQEAFSRADAFEVFFGGAAGPGKTILLLNEGLRQVTNPGYRAVFFRRVFKELAQVVEMSYETFPEHGGRFTRSDHTWRFPRYHRSAHAQVRRAKTYDGATYLFSFAERGEQKLRHQGAAYAYIAFDELTQWPIDEIYTYLFLRCRPFKQGLGVRCYIRTASNPGGPGHGWVKERFIDGRKPFAVYRETVEDTISGTKRIYHRQFIPATLDSNDLMDPMYEIALLSYPDPEIRRAMRWGHWDIAAGVMFSELRDGLHRVGARPPLPWTQKEIVVDWGYENYAVAGWFETTSGIADRVPHSWLYREMCEQRMIAPLFAQTLVERTPPEERAQIHQVTIDTNAWAVSSETGRAPIEDMLPYFHEVGWSAKPATKGAGSRARGWQLLHTYFFPKRYGGPLLRIMDNCSVTWSQLSTLARGVPPHDIEDIEPNQVDDAADMVRMWAQSRPEPARPTPDEILMRDEVLDFALDPKSYEFQQIERFRKHNFPAVKVGRSKRKRGKRK